MPDNKIDDKQFNFVRQKIVFFIFFDDLPPLNSLFKPDPLRFNGYNSIFLWVQCHRIPWSGRREAQNIRKQFPVRYPGRSPDRQFIPPQIFFEKIPAFLPLNRDSLFHSRPSSNLSLVRRNLFDYLKMYIYELP